MIALVANREYLSCHSCFCFDAPPAENRRSMYQKVLGEMANFAVFVQ